MRFTLVAFLTVLLLTSSLLSQEQNKKDQLPQITPDLLLPDKSDSRIAQANKVQVFKLFPRGKFDPIKNNSLIRGGGAYYSFSTKSHDYDSTPEIELQQDQLYTGFAGANYGMIADLKNLPLASIDEKTPAVINLLNYRMKNLLREARAEYKILHVGLTLDRIRYKRNLPAIVGHSYVLRAISFGEADTLVAFQISRRKSDGSLVIFWKKLREFETPKLIRKNDRSPVSISYAEDLSRSEKIRKLGKTFAEINQKKHELDQKEEQLKKSVDTLIAVSYEDELEAQRIGARAIRLFPDKVLDKILPDYRASSFSVGSLTEIAHYYASPRIEYSQGSLSFIQDKDILGFIASLGGTLPENIDRQTREVIALSKYRPSEKPEEEKKQINIDGVNFGKTVPAIPGNTYIFRGISYGKGDKILVLKIQRKDSDGSIVLFIKEISSFYPPQIAQTSKVSLPDQSTKFIVENALRKKGFYDISVEATTIEVTLRGSVPKGKMVDAVRTAAEIGGGRKINNQLIEK